MLDAQRQLLLACARAYLNTPFHHQGRVRGENGGVDCIGLLVCAAKDAGHPTHDSQSYPRYPDGKTLISEFEKAGMVKIDRALSLPGDVAVFWMTHPLRPCHAGMLSEQGRMIHTWASVEMVVEHTMDDRWFKRWCATYRFPWLT